MFYNLISKRISIRINKIEDARRIFEYLRILENF